MRERVKQYILEQNLLKNGRGVLVAVSGGRDSVALLHVLAGLVPELGLSLSAAHFNHNLRPESAEEYRFVRELCDRMGIPFFGGEGQVAEAARREKLSLEVAARRERHRFFVEALVQSRCDVLATAHHADDQAETFLLRLLRGAGAAGLSAMAPMEGSIIRPLLGINRQEITRYCAEQGLSWREDASNASLEIPRNRVRHQLLPYLEQYFNPGVRQVLLRSAALLRSDDDYLHQLALQAYERLCGKETPWSAQLDGLTQLADPVATRVIRIMLCRAGRRQDVEALHVERALKLARAGHTGQRIDVGGGFIVVRDAHRLTVVPPQTARPGFCLRARLPGIVDGPSGVLSAALLAQPPDSPKIRDPLVQFVDADKAEGELYLRTRLPGDRIHPLGAPGNKKLKDYFIDKKVEQRKRADWPLLCRADEVLWAVGLCISQSVAADEKTKRVLRLEYRPDGTERNVKRGE